MPSRFDQLYNLNYSTFLTEDVTKLVVPYDDVSPNTATFSAEAPEQKTTTPDDDDNWIRIRVKAFDRKIKKGKRHRETIDPETKRYIYGDRYDVIRLMDTKGKTYVMIKPYLNQNVSFNDSIVGQIVQVKPADNANLESNRIPITDIRKSN